MAARVSISTQPRTRVGSLGRMGSPFRDRSTVMRPPRLAALKTRDYGKRPDNPAQTQQGAGFGTTGLTGET